jgi:hypothetical protein
LSDRKKNVELSGQYSVLGPQKMMENLLVSLMLVVAILQING